MEKEVNVFYDVETTGVNHRKNCIHELSYIVEVNGVVVTEKELHLAPHPAAIIEPKALQVGGVTEEQIKAYPPFREGYQTFRNDVLRHVDKYNPKSKAYLIGFNNRAFDDFFLRKLFELCDDTYFGSYFWTDSDDALLTASRYLRGARRKNMKNFKLATVAQELGIEVKEEDLHKASYDVYLTRQVYRITTGTDLEL